MSRILTGVEWSLLNCALLGEPINSTLEQRLLAEVRLRCRENAASRLKEVPEAPNLSALIDQEWQAARRQEQHIMPRLREQIAILELLAERLESPLEQDALETAINSLHERGGEVEAYTSYAARASRIAAEEEDRS